MITIVSGLPRSGTSLMMQILEKCGMEILSDQLRKPDDNNPRGYYEYEKVKSLMRDNSWLDDADGKVMKVIAQLIPSLPDGFNYTVIFMQRNMDEILLSQEKMIGNLAGKQAAVDKNVLKKTFEQQVERVKNYMSSVKNFTVFEVNYNNLLTQKYDELIAVMEALNLNSDQAQEAIDTSLYRNRITNN